MLEIFICHLLVCVKQFGSVDRAFKTVWYILEKNVDIRCSNHYIYGHYCMYSLRFFSFFITGYRYLLMISANYATFRAKKRMLLRINSQTISIIFLQTQAGGIQVVNLPRAKWLINNFVNEELRSWEKKLKLMSFKSMKMACYSHYMHGNLAYLM